MNPYDYYTPIRASRPFQPGVSGGGGVPIIEKLVGVSTAGSVGSNTPGGGSFATSTPGQVAAFATGPAASALATKGYLKVSEWDGTSNYKLLVWNSSDVLIGVSDARSISTGQYDSYQEFTFSTPPTIVEGQTYRLGYIPDTGFQNAYEIASGGGKHYGGNNYTTPTNWSETDVITASITIAVYLTGDTQ